MSGPRDGLLGVGDRRGKSDRRALGQDETDLFFSI